MLKNKKYIDLAIYIILFMISFSVFCFSKFRFVFDYQNYHVYNPWAFLTERYGVDFMAANFRSYFNPIINIPHYLIIKYINLPLVLRLFNAFLFSILLFLTYKITDFVIVADKIKKYVVIIFSILIFAFAPAVELVSNAASPDIFVAIFTLFAIFLIIKNIFKNDSNKKRLIFALIGFILGAIAGLKNAGIYYCISTVLTNIFLFKKIEKPFKLTLILLMGMILGWIMTGGWWFYFVYKMFQNPTFPYANEFFKSPFADISSVMVKDYTLFKPNTVYQYLFYPFWGLSKFKSHGLGYNFFDWRYIFMFVSEFGLLLFAIFKKKKEVSPIISNNNLYYIMVLVITTYYTNITFTALYRFTISIIALFGIIYVAFISAVASRIKEKKELLFYLFVTFILIAQFGTIYVNPYNKTYDFSKYILKVEDMKIKDDAIVILATEKTSFVLPYQNPNVQYIFWSVPDEVLNKIEHRKNFYFYKSDYLDKRIKNIFRNDIKKRPVYLIYSGIMDYHDPKLVQTTLDYYSYPTKYVLNENVCKDIKNNLEEIYLCKLN